MLPARLLNISGEFGGSLRNQFLGKPSPVRCQGYVCGASSKWAPNGW